MTARVSVVHKGFFEPWTFDPLIHSFRAIHEAADFRARNPKTRCGCESCVILRAARRESTQAGGRE